MQQLTGSYQRKHSLPNPRLKLEAHLLRRAPLAQSVHRNRVTHPWVVLIHLSDVLISFKLFPPNPAWQSRSYRMQQCREEEEHLAKQKTTSFASPARSSKTSISSSNSSSTLFQYLTKNDGNIKDHGHICLPHRCYPSSAVIIVKIPVFQSIIATL